jgi:TonB family protein
MVDSTAAYERDSGATGYVPINGTRPVGDRAPRAGNLQPDDLNAAGPEHASALLKMGALKQDAGAYSEAEELFRRALEIGERSVGADNPALIPALTSLASACVMCGKLDDAQQLAVRAVAISERGLAEHEPDVAFLINDLARLCLKQSAHAVAEPLLLRLLEMKRSKGEDHPEVGTVLASLATVRHALGRHESAEQLWRRVLEIRDRTLAPNHFSLAIALEHLAEACAARGKIVEALQHFQRAQTIRELTLGAGHPSLRIARDRIADLQLQAGESLDAAHDAAVPVQMPEKYRLLAVNNPVEKHSMVASPQARERSTATRKGTAKVIEAELKEEIVSPPPAPPVKMAATGAQPANAESVPYRDLILSMRQEIEDDASVDATAPARSGFVATFLAEVKQPQKATVIVVGVVAALAILATASRAWTEQDPPAIGGDASLTSVASTSAPATSDASTRSVVAANDPANTPAIAAAAATPVTASRIRLADQRPAAKKPTESRSEQQPRIAIPKMSSALTAGFDSVVRARSASSGEGDPLVQLASAVATPQRMTFDREDAINQAQRAQLIGSLPVPRYPAQLVDVQGEVRVRFDVDVTGRPVMSTVSVLSSPNTILTAAVLKVIPTIRFEPARSGGPDSKPIADVVQLGFQFRPSK